MFLLLSLKLTTYKYVVSGRTIPVIATFILQKTAFTAQKAHIFCQL